MAGTGCRSRAAATSLESGSLNSPTLCLGTGAVPRGSAPAATVGYCRILEYRTGHSGIVPGRLQALGWMRLARIRRSRRWRLHATQVGER